MAEQVPESLLTRLSEFITARIGLHFPPEKWRDLKRNLNPLAAEFGFENAVDWVQWLLATDLTRAEMERLASYLTVGETYFFREKQIFEILAERVVAKWRDKRQGAAQRLRIWSAGCCSGEEPYSIAMVLSKTIPDWKRWNITILASDINPRFLRKAARGIYNEWSFRDTPAWVKRDCFKKSHRNSYEILPQFKEMVTFAYLNLADDDYPSLQNNTNAMDLIFCRNVLMYFSEEQAQKVIDRFHSALADDGVLIVSGTETSSVLYRQFAAINFDGFTFYKKTNRKIEAPEFSFPRQTISSVPSTPSARVATEFSAPPPVNPPHEPATRRQPSLYEEATELYESGSYAEAVEKLFGADPVILADAKTAALLARAFANQGKLNESLDWCDRAIAANKMDPQLHYLRAIVLQEQGNLEASVAALKRALYLDPDFVLAYFALGNLALRRDAFDEADRHFENALALLEQSPAETVLPGSEGLTSARLSEIIRATMRQVKTT